MKVFFCILRYEYSAYVILLSNNFCFCFEKGNVKYLNGFHITLSIV